MSEKEEGEEGVLKNTGILNLKDITEEELEHLKKIKNVGILIVPKNLMGRISAKIENVGVVIPYEEGMRIYSGESKLNADVLKSLEEPTGIINAGKLIIEKNTPAELITEKIKEIKNYGKILIPKQAYGALMSRVSENTGKIEILEKVIEEKIKELEKELGELRESK